jgi:thiol-disulfide isomerase/thioredoxin
MFKTKYFWKGYILGIAIALLGVSYIILKLNTERPLEAIKGFDELKFVSLKGDTISIKKAGSDPVMINYWATYCGPCIKEMPVLLAFSKKYPKVKLWLLTQENTDVINRFITKHPELKELSFAHIVIKENSNGISTIAGTLPTTFLVNAKSKLLWKNDGGLPQETPTALLDSIQKSVPEIKKIVSQN